MGLRGTTARGDGRSASDSKSPFSCPHANEPASVADLAIRAELEANLRSAEHSDLLRFLAEPESPENSAAIRSGSTLDKLARTQTCVEIQNCPQGP